jgi:hypothetical protein
MSSTAGHCSPHRPVIETRTLGCSGHWLTSLAKSVFIFLLRHCITMSASDMVLNYSFLCAFEQVKRHPHLRLSTWHGYLHRFGFLSLSRDWRSCCLLSTWAVISLWPIWPFHLFTVFHPADVTHARSSLGRYFLVSTICTVPINSTRSRFNLLVSML